MSKNQYKSAVTGILMILAFAIGCTKIDTTTLGENLIPPVDNIHTFDTTYSVIAVNYDSTECDTIYSYRFAAFRNYLKRSHYLENYYANVYFELKPDFYPYNFPAADANSIEIDSAIMVLPYSSFFRGYKHIAKGKCLPAFRYI